MSETRILYLSYQPSDNSIDFGLLGAPLTDSLIASKRKEIAECLRDLAKRLDSREYPFCNLFARLADGQPTFYEDQLPDDMTDGEYAAWFAQSKVVDGVRMGPEFPPAQVTHHCPACEAAATELAEARDDRELLVNRLRAATALNEQLTLEAAEARGASKRMERELADLRARLSACAAAVRAHEERIQGLLDGSEAGRLEAYCEQLRQACHQRLAETVEQKQLADDLRARLAAEAEALSHQAEALSNKGNPMALGLQHAAGRIRALLAEGKEK